MIPYAIIPEKLSLNRIQKLIQDRELMPARRMLQQGLEENINILKHAGISNLKELNSRINKKENLNDFANQLGIKSEYLILLNREANSFISKPVLLSSFLAIEPNIIEKLGHNNLRNSKGYFEAVQFIGISKLATKLNIDREKLIELFCLCDLVRIWGVGSIFAQIILESGTNSVSEFIKTDPILAYKKFLETNNKLKLTKAVFIENDIIFCNRMAKEVEIVDVNNIIAS